MTAIVVDVAGVQAATRRLASVQTDLAFARSRVDRAREQLVVHPDDRGISAVPHQLDTIAHRLGGVTNHLADDERRTRNFLQRALELDGRSGRTRSRWTVGAWWRRLRTASSTRLDSARARLVRSARIGWSSLRRLGRTGVSLLRRSGAFVHRKVDQWKHTVTTTARRFVVDGWRRIRSWASRTWKKVTGFFTRVWNAAYQALRAITTAMLAVVLHLVVLAVVAVGVVVLGARLLFGAGYRLGEKIDRWIDGPLPPITPTQADGRDTLAHHTDLCGNESAIPKNHIGITKVGADDKYIVTLPGVEDLTAGMDLAKQDKDVRRLFEAWLAANPSGSERDMSVAWQAFLLDKNAYATVVAAIIRQKVPKGAQVMLVGHSHGAYTAMDLAADPAFNNQSGAEGSYRVTHVLAMGAATDVEARKVRPPTEKLIVNNWYDVPNAVEEGVTAHRRGLAPVQGPDSVNFFGPVGNLGKAGHDTRDYGSFIRNDNSNQKLRAFMDSVGATYGDASAYPTEQVSLDTAEAR